MGLEVLASDTVTPSMRVNETTFQDEWLKVLVNISDNSGFVLINFLEFQILRQVDDLWARKTEMIVKIRLHLHIVDSHE